MSVRTVHLPPEVTRPIAMPPIISLIGTPASSRASVDPHVEAIAEAPLAPGVSLRVRAQVLLGDSLAELLLQDLLEDRGDLFLRERRALNGGELRDRLELQIVEAGFALSLVGVAELGAQPLAQERRNRAEAARFGD